MVQAGKKIVIVAGEPSSDLLAADLIQQLQQTTNNYQIIAVGGAKIRATGVEVFQDNEAFSVMGLFEVFKDLPRLLRLKKQIVERIVAEKPDVFIGVDSPDLNFSIAQALKKHSIPVIHYVSPSVWAWRPKRVFKMAQFIDHVMCLFPFETNIYQQAGLSASFVGHPLAQQIAIDLQKPVNQQPLLAVLPGSRSREINVLMPLFLQTVKQLKNVQLASANVSPKKIAWCQQMADEAGLTLQWFDDANELLKQADMALLGSGTVALQAMLCQTPMVVAYRIASLTWWVVNTFKMLQQPYYSLPNVLHQGFLVPEVMQKELTKKNLLTALGKISDSEQQLVMKTRFKVLHRELMPPEPLATAKNIEQFLESRSKC